MSHQDFDHGEKPLPVPEADLIAALQEQAAKLTALGQNRITAGAPGEPVLFERVSDAGFLVRRLPDDPLATRISIGQPHGGTPGAYLVFRGDPQVIAALLRWAQTALEAALAT